MRWPHVRYALVLGVLYAVLFAVTAISPAHRADWALENAIAALFVALLVATRNVFPLSRLSYTTIFVFLVLHTIGAHYTYSEVPYDAWFRSVTGRSLDAMLGFERNHFDRVVHFSYGLLLAYPVRELFLRVADARGVWGYLLPLDVMLSTSLLYELIEWGAAEVFGGELGTAYLGTQGDEWDAQKDMALAALGALIAMSTTATVNVCLHRDFARELAESVRVKRRAPLGEDAIAEAMRAPDGRGADGNRGQTDSPQRH